MPDETCLACDVVAGRVVPPGGMIYTGAHWLVSHQVSPALLPGFLIVKTRRHVDHIAELTSEESAELGVILQRTAAALTQAVQPEKVYVCSFGEKVTHIHFYVIPRYAYLPASGLRVLLQLMRKRAYVASDEDAAHIAAQVRAIMAENQ